LSSDNFPAENRQKRMPAGDNTGLQAKFQGDARAEIEGVRRSDGI
jgi:hypothetical protein